MTDNVELGRHTKFCQGGAGTLGWLPRAVSYVTSTKTRQLSPTRESRELEICSQIRDISRTAGAGIDKRENCTRAIKQESSMRYCARDGCGDWIFHLSFCLYRLHPFTGSHANDGPRTAVVLQAKLTESLLLGRCGHGQRYGIKA